MSMLILQRNHSNRDTVSFAITMLSNGFIKIHPGATNTRGLVRFSK